MRRASIRVSTLAVVVALLLAVGAGFAGSPLAQDASDANGAFLDESGDPIDGDPIDGDPIDGDATTTEPALVSSGTLGAVALAVTLALLVVAAVRRADS